MVDIAVDLPDDFRKRPDGTMLTREEAVREAGIIMTQASEYFRPLHLIFNIAAIETVAEGETDAYGDAVQQRDAYKVLQTAVEKWRRKAAPARNLVVVLAGSHFSGKSGLSYPSTSCTTPDYSVVFATRGGDTPFHHYVFAQTLAHEIGHYLGMSHDPASYGAGPSLMWPSFVLYTSGFSQTSLEQAAGRIGVDSPGGSCFPMAPADALFASDGDGDGRTDADETREGTDPFDAGSFRAELSSPFFALWNSFLNTINIAEIGNPGAEAVSAKVTLFSLDGRVLAQRTITVPARGQFDLIVNDLPGFVRDSYGLLKIEFTGTLSGRMSYYRNSAYGRSFEFAYNISFSNGSLGRTEVAFNTYQPSKDSAEANNEVANWLSLVNLSADPKDFAVYSFDAQGQAIRSQVLTVPGWGRTDIDGGHGFAGPYKSGFHEIIPADPASAYQALLVRYGADAPAGVAAASYSFAYPLLGRAGTGRPLHFFVSSGKGQENWLEMTNTATGRANAVLQLSAHDGNIFYESEVKLHAHEQRHVDLSAALAAAGEEEAFLAVYPAEPNSISAETMFYNREEIRGRITSVYGVQGQDNERTLAWGSYNLFLGMENRLRVANPGDSSADVLVEASGFAGEARQMLNIPARSFLVLPLRSGQAFALAGESYGLVSVNSRNGVPLVSELTREREVEDEVDFISPIDLY